jgi:hypothetical protein
VAGGRREIAPCRPSFWPVSLRARKLRKLASPTAIRAWPADPPAAVRQRGTEKVLGWHRPRVVVECGGAFVKSPRGRPGPGIATDNNK